MKKTVIRWVPARGTFGKLVSEGEFDELLVLASDWLANNNEDENVVFEVSKSGEPGVWRMNPNGVRSSMEVTENVSALIDECHDHLIDTVEEAIWGASDEEIVEEVR